jgi:hypothetical protein
MNLQTRETGEDCYQKYIYNLTSFYVLLDVLIGSWLCPLELIWINLGFHKISYIAFSASFNHDAWTRYDVVERRSVLVM